MQLFKQLTLHTYISLAAAYVCVCLCVRTTLCSALHSDSQQQRLEGTEPKTSSFYD